MFGGSISLFAGWMLTHCSHATNGACYEEIAMASFGKRAQGFTSVCMILCNGGFVISYIVLVSLLLMLTFLKFKSFMPFSLQTATGQHLPKWCDDSRGGQAFWAVLFSVSLLNFKTSDLLCVPSFHSTRSIHAKIYFRILCYDEFLHRPRHSFRMSAKPWNIAINQRRVLGSSSRKTTF